ncbi:MAG: HepT-like ribonuclease domain-containing protein [Pseudomonadota bacterium]|nr:HepT-like ribonuclease domain-containing protein [Pseudomonadota bacterium]
MADRYGARKIRVFGSFADGNVDDNSDLDLLVELEQGRDLLDLIGFKQELEEFFTTKMIQDAVIRNLEIIGEAVKNLSLSFRTEHPDVPWKQIAGLYAVLIHHYFGVDIDSVW